MVVTPDNYKLQRVPSPRWATPSSSQHRGLWSELQISQISSSSC